MRYFLPLAILTFAFLTAAPPASADNFGLAMHGDPKHGPDSPHLSYVNPEAPRGGSVTYAAIGSFDSLNPFAIKGTPAQGLHFIYERLMARSWDEPFTLYPLIAESYEVGDNRSWISFTLNPEARFSDGTPITVEDVIFSFETLKEDGRPNFRRVFAVVEEITTPDENTVRFDLGDGHDQETVMILAIMPVLSKAFWKDRTFDSSILTQPVTSGPYRVADVDPGSKITFERRDDYWGEDLFYNRGQYNFERITYEYYRDKNVAYEAFQAGEIDFWREDDAGRWSRALAQDTEFIAKTFPHSRPERVNAFIYNTRREPFDNRNVRKALAYTLNAGWINENLYNGKYKRITSFYPNSELAARGTPEGRERMILEVWKDDLPPEVFGPAYVPPLNKSRRDLRGNLREAAGLLRSAGWIVKDGVRVHEQSGKPFEFEIILNDSKQEKIGLALIRNLEKLGIKANLRVLDSAAFIGRLNKFDYDMVLHYWQSSLSPGTEQILFWGCEAAKQEARWNYAGICHRAVDDLALRIANSKSREELVALTRALDRILTYGHYMIPLFYRGEDWVSYWPSLEHPGQTPVYGLIQESWWQNLKNAQAD